jgi:C1A family cysteine protease/acylphosphatase
MEPIAELNAKIQASNANWQAKQTPQSQMSNQQKARLLGVVVDRAALDAAMASVAEAPVSNFASAVDWRNYNGNHITSVKDQGNCGSCVSFCTVATVESLASIEKNQKLDLSEADLHFCSAHGASCGGWWPNDAYNALKTRGTPDEACFPYSSAFNGSGQPSCIVGPERDARAVKITESTTLANIVDRKNWLTNVGPCSAVFHVFNDFFAYGSGVYRHVSGEDVGLHCVEVIGYSEAEQCWICKNSWGASWGDQGFFKIAYGQAGIDSEFPFWTAKGVVLPAKNHWSSLGGFVKQVVPISNADGRIEVLAIGSDNALWHLWQTAPNNGWSGWASLGGGVKQISAIRNADGRIEILAIGSDDALWHMWQTAPSNGWSSWASLGGGVKQVFPISNADGRIEILAIGSDDALWHMWQTAPSNGWSSWASLGGGVKQISAVRNADGRIEILAIGMDNALWHMWQTAPNNGWSSWASLGGGVKQLFPINNADGRIEVLAIGTDNALWHMWQTAPSNGWSSWASLGGFVKQISAARNADGRIEILAIGSDDALWHMWQTAPSNGWSSWASLSGAVKQIAPANNADGRIEVLAIGMDNALWHIWQTAPNNGWS